MKMKKAAAMFLAATMVVSMAACGGSKDEGSSKAESSDTLIVGTEAGFAPYEYMKGDEVVGIDMDISKAIAEDMGRELEIKNMDFDGALVAVTNGKVDMVAAAVSVDPEREKTMDFSEPYVDNTEVVVINTESQNLVPAGDGVTGDDLKDKIVGVQQGNIADIWCANKDNAQPKEIKRYTKFAQAAADLKNNKIDCIVMDQYPAESLVEENPTLKILDGTLFEDKYAIAVKKGNTELLDQINKTIAKLKEDGKIDEFTASHAGN